MKQVTLFLTLVLYALCSCSVLEQRSDCQAPVSIQVDNFSFLQEDFPTKAPQAVADYSGVKAITLGFYASDGTEQYKKTQLRADAETYDTFGQFDCSLPLGSYTMVVLGYGSEVPITLTSASSASYTEDKVRETFVYSQTVNVDDITPLTLSATLSRIIARLSIISTDVKPANVASLRYVFSKGSKSFNPTTGLAADDNGFTNIVALESETGEITKTLSNLFLVTDEETMDVTIESLDASGNVLYRKTVQNIPFKRNRATIMTGSLFSVAANIGFSVETSFLTEYRMSF